MKINVGLGSRNDGKDSPIPDKTVKIIANSIYQTLRDEGCQNKDIIGVSSQLIGLVTTALEENKKTDTQK